MFGGENYFSGQHGFTRRITYFENCHFPACRINFHIHIKFLQEKGVTCIICREGKMEPVATITPNDGWIFAIPKASDMDISVYRFREKELADNGRQQTKTYNNYKIQQ